MNVIMEDARSLRYGCLVHYYCLWCISIHRGFARNFKEGKYLNTFLGIVYVEGGCPCKLAGLPKPWVKEVFIFILKHKGFSC